YERPCHRAAKRDDEFSSPDMDCHATLPKGACNGVDNITPGRAALREFKPAQVGLGSKALIAGLARPSADIRSSSKPDADARGDPGAPLRGQGRRFSKLTMPWPIAPADLPMPRPVQELRKLRKMRRYARGNPSEQLQIFPARAVFHVRKAGGVAAPRRRQ